MIEPTPFRRFRCPGYREIELAWRPAREVERRLADWQPEAIHIATEGPLGSAARRYSVPGPLDVVSDSDGGVLHDDLRVAALQALELSRHGARARALEFDWRLVCEQFLSLLVANRVPAGRLAPAAP